MKLIWLEKECHLLPPTWTYQKLSKLQRYNLIELFNKKYKIKKNNHNNLENLYKTCIIYIIRKMMLMLSILVMDFFLNVMILLEHVSKTESNLLVLLLMLFTWWAIKLRLERPPLLTMFQLFQEQKVLLKVWMR